MALILLIVLLVGCERSERDDRIALKTIVAPGGTATAHFVGERPASDPGEPKPPLEFGVRSLYFTFPDDTRRYLFRPHGELYFSDWHFEVFSTDGSFTALLQSHYGPITVVPTSRLRNFLTGDVTAIETVLPPPTESGTARVLDEWRWIGPHELEFRAACCGTSELFRRTLGGAHAHQ